MNIYYFIQLEKGKQILFRNLDRYTSSKNLPANAGDMRDVGSVPGSGRSPRGGNDSPLQSSCLENFMDRGAWQTAVQSVTQNLTGMNRPSMHAHTCR